MNHDHGAMLDPLSFGAFWTTWTMNTVWALIAVVLLSLYVAAYARAKRRQHEAPVSSMRVVAFVAGCVSLVWSTCSAVEAYAMSLFSMHMVQHLLLIMVVPVLLAVGHPLTVWRASLSTEGQARFDATTQAWPVALLTHPLCGLGIYTAVIVATHLTSFMDAMARHGSLMFAEQLLYVVSGYLFFMPALAREPIRWDTPPLMRMALMLIGMTPDTVVGIVLMQGTVLFPAYMSGRPAWAMPGTDDQYLGGSIMWFFGDGAMMVLGVILLLAFVLQPSKGQTMGTYLEGVRRSTLQSEIEAGGQSLGEGDVDDDDAALEAYNRMLQRMAEHEQR